MQKIKNKIKANNLRVHIIGIGGKGLNGIAAFCINKGFKVSGSDQKDSLEVKKLREKNVEISIGHFKENINKTIDVVVISSIIDEENPEIKEAKKLKIPIIKRAEFLGFLTEDDIRISIAGSHGKSTTTALVGSLLKENNFKPNVFGGAYYDDFNGYSYLGCGGYSVIEACEYDRSFFHLTADYTIITSLEKSHLEYYKDEQEMNGAFREFIKKHKLSATIIVDGDNPELRTISRFRNRKIITVGQNSANDYRIADISLRAGLTSWTIYKPNKEKVRITTFLPGIHSIYNISCVVVLAESLGIDEKDYLKVINSFNGVKRRFDTYVLPNGLNIVDDFSHHPTQVRCTIKSIKQWYPYHDIYVVFQPRHFKHMRDFRVEYGKAFRGVDRVYISDIVRALDDKEIDEKLITKEEIGHNINVYSDILDIRYTGDITNTSAVVCGDVRHITKPTVICTLGAGNVDLVKDNLIKRYNKKTYAKLQSVGK